MNDVDLQSPTPKSKENVIVAHRDTQLTGQLLPLVVNLCHVGNYEQRTLSVIKQCSLDTTVTLGTHEPSPGQPLNRY